MTKVLLLANSIGKILSAIEIIELHQSPKAIAKVLRQLYLNNNTTLVPAHGTTFSIMITKLPQNNNLNDVDLYY
jgi:hypothetical protein